MSRSTGYSTPSTTGPRAVSFSTPRPLVSTRCTLGRLNAGRYSSWKHTRLQCLPQYGLSFSAVSGSSTISSMRCRIASMVSKSDRSSASNSSSESGALLGVDPHHLGPAVVDQVHVGLGAGHRLGEVDDPLLLPAGLETLGTTRHRWVAGCARPPPPGSAGRRRAPRPHGRSGAPPARRWRRCR